LNNSGLRPLEYNIVVKPQDVERKTKGGLLLADSTIEKEEFGRTEGVIVATSPMAFKFDDWPADEPRPAPGDRIMFSKYNAKSFKGIDGGDYWIMKDKDVLGVLQ
jgi:chaperonin GroES